jgi:hypothetical protein
LIKNDRKVACKKKIRFIHKYKREVKKLMLDHPFDISPSVQEVNGSGQYNKGDCRMGDAITGICFMKNQ